MILNKLRGNVELNFALSLSPIIEAYPYSTFHMGFKLSYRTGAKLKSEAYNLQIGQTVYIAK